MGEWGNKLPGRLVFPQKYEATNRKHSLPDLLIMCQKCVKTHLQAFAISKISPGLYPRTPTNEGRG